MKTLIIFLLLCTSCLKNTEGVKNVFNTEPMNDASLSTLSLLPATRYAIIASAATPNYTFTVVGGRAPYTYAMATSIGGTINGSGRYTPPNLVGSEVVRVTDATGQYAESTVIISNPVSIYPSDLTRVVPYQGNLGITATGGVPPYSYSLVSGGGFLQSFGFANTTYYAPTVVSADSTAVVRVHDALGMYSDTTISIVQPTALAISPLSRFATTGNSLITSNGSITFAYTASGGYPPYTYSILSGPGTINPMSGIYTRPNDSSTDSRTVVIRVTDAENTTRDSVLFLQPIVQAAPASTSVAAGQQVRLDGIGGVCPYTFTKVSGGGTLSTVTSTALNYAQGSTNCNSGIFVAPLTAGTSVVRILDAVNHWSDVTVTTTGTASASDESNYTISPVTRIVTTRSSLTDTLPVSFPYTMSGGFPPYTLSLVSGPGTITSNFNYLPPADSANVLRTAVVRSTDFLGVVRKATIFIQPKLNVFTTPIQPTNLWAVGTTLSFPQQTLPSTTFNRTIAIGSQVRIDGSGGACPYTYSQTLGSGTLNNFTFTTTNFSQASTACGMSVYSAPDVAETAEVRVHDAQGNSELATITVVDNAQGARDWSYGTGGTQTISFGSDNDFLKDMVRDGANNLYLAGYSWNTTNLSFDFAVAKVRANGTLDPAFGTAGLVRIDLSSSRNDYATSLALQADGKVVVGGYCDSASTGYDFCAVRLSTTGTLDTTFDGDGIWSGATLQSGVKSEYLMSVAITSGGKIALAGHCNTAAGNGFDLCMSVLTSAGALDTTFNTTGNLIVAVAGADYLGNILVANGSSFLLGGQCNTQFCVYKYGPTGTLDSSFGNNNGFARFPAAPNLSLTNNTPVIMAAQNDGKLVLGGAAATSGNDYSYAVAKLNQDGTFDDFFGTEGRVLYSQSVYNSGGSTGSLADFVHNLVIQPNGKILAVGKTYNSSFGYDFSAMQLNEDGSPDLSFGSAGRLSYGVQASAYTEGAVLRTDGKALIAGSAMIGGKAKFSLIQISP